LLTQKDGDMRSRLFAKCKMKIRTRLFVVQSHVGLYEVFSKLHTVVAHLRLDNIISFFAFTVKYHKVI